MQIQRTKDVERFLALGLAQVLEQVLDPGLGRGRGHEGADWRSAQGAPENLYRLPRLGIEEQRFPGLGDGLARTPGVEVAAGPDEVRLQGLRRLFPRGPRQVGVKTGLESRVEQVGSKGSELG